MTTSKRSDKPPPFEQKFGLGQFRDSSRRTVRRLLRTASLFVAEKVDRKKREVVLETEVWSWGKGKQCQLGHGDMLDR